MTNSIILITGASSGFGSFTAHALADQGHTVYAGMRQTATRKAQQARAAAEYSAERDVDLRAIELDVNYQDSVDAAVERVISEHGRIDVLIHNAGHMVTGPSEAFTPNSSPSCSMSTCSRRSGSTAPRCRTCAPRDAAW